MSEKQTYTTENDDFLKKAALKAAGVSGVLLAGAGAWAVGQNIQNEQSHTAAQEAMNIEQVELEAYNNSIEAAINTEYDTSQVVGEIEVTQDSNLINPALSIVENSLGSDAYSDIQGRIYSPLLETAQSHNSQPGEQYSVVSVDINPAAADGNEFIVVDSNNIIQSEAPTIPSPIISDGSSNEASN